jgi:ATP-dependent Lhr-like helicase
MDIRGLEALLLAVERGEVRLEARDLKEPSSLAQEVIHARPYAFLDDAPLEERRTRAIQTRRWHDPAESGDLGRLDPEAIAAVRAEAWPQVRGPDELHDALMLTGFLTAAEIATGRSEAMLRDAPPAVGPPSAADGGWTEALEVLKAHNRVAAFRARPDAPAAWTAAERLPQILTALPGVSLLWTPELPNRPDLLRPLPPRAAPAGDVAAGAAAPPAAACGIPAATTLAPAACPEAGREDEALVEILRGRLESLGPVRAGALAESLGIAGQRADFALLALEQEGFALRGRFTPAAAASPLVASALAAAVASAGGPESLADGGDAAAASRDIEWCERRLLARIHRYTLARLRREIEPVSAAAYQSFLFSWQGIAGETPGGETPGGETPGGGTPGLAARRSRTSMPERAGGPEAVEAVLALLEGYEAPAAAWEKDILPARLEGYEPAWLDLQGLSGQFIWGRVRPAGGLQTLGPEGTRKTSLIKATPVAFLGRDNVDLWLSAAGPSPLPAPAPLAAAGEAGALSAATEGTAPEGPAGVVLEHLRRRGASFWREILRDTGLAAAEARDGIAELAALGWLTSDGFRGLRALLPAATPGGEGLERAGRWSLLRDGNTEVSAAGKGREAGLPGKDLETLARVMLRRYGVVFRKLVDRENLTPPWRDLVRTLRLLEARGEVRGGRFVEGFYGEQFALPEAVGLLRALRKQGGSGEWVSLCAADPANLQGIVTPGPRIPAQRKNRILFRDGIPVAGLDGGEVRILHAQEGGRDDDWETRLRSFVPRLRVIEPLPPIANQVG